MRWRIGLAECAPYESLGTSSSALQELAVAHPRFARGHGDGRNADALLRQEAGHSLDWRDVRAGRCIFGGTIARFCSLEHVATAHRLDAHGGKRAAARDDTAEHRRGVPRHRRVGPRDDDEWRRAAAHRLERVGGARQTARRSLPKFSSQPRRNRGKALLPERCGATRPQPRPTTPRSLRGAASSA